VSDFRSQLRPGFSQREALIQRVSWFLLALVPLAAILGLLGGGIYSDRTVTDGQNGDVVNLTYSRWGRMHSGLSLRLTLDVAARPAAEEVSLSLSRGFARNVQIDSIVPEPDSTSLGPEGAVFGWQVDGWSQPLSITVHYQSNTWPKLEGDVGLRAGSQQLAMFSISQFLLP